MQHPTIIHDCADARLRDLRRAAGLDVVAPSLHAHHAWSAPLGLLRLAARRVAGTVTGTTNTMRDSAATTERRASPGRVVTVQEDVRWKL